MPQFLSIQHRPFKANLKKCWGTFLEVVVAFRARKAILCAQCHH